MTTDSVTLRVGTYNTLDGGRDGGSYRRWAAQMNMLKLLDLDVLCLQEAKHWDEDGSARLHATAAALDMEARLAPSASHGCHLVTLVRLPTVRFVRFLPDIAEGNFHHTVSRADLRIAGVEWELRTLHTHLDPFSPDDRASEVKWLTEDGGRDDALLIGDLNCEAPGDPSPSSWDWIPDHLHSRHRSQRADGSYGGIDRRAVHALLQAGFRDPAAVLGIDPHRTAGHWNPDELRDHRTDYVLPTRSLLTRRAALLSYTVVDTGLTRSLADHLPVVADLALRPGST
jgi:exodeoxyribonuclease III